MVKKIFRSIFVTSFFGWDNIKWIIREFMKMYSNQDSYFSKKRFESSIAFISAVGVILCFIWTHRHTIENSELLADAALLFGIAGYTVNAIQKEKKLQSSNTNELGDEKSSKEELG